MTSAAKKSAHPSGSVTYVDDVFSTYLYTGTGSTQTINNGIDLSTYGGLTWSKRRDSASGGNHVLIDTVRGVGNYINSNTTSAQATDAQTVTAFGTTGYSIGTSTRNNISAGTYASWTFRKAAKFFDVVTYTGDGVAGRTIAHNLGSTPGFIIVKGVDIARFWACYHTSLGATKYIELSSTGAAVTDSTFWNDTAPTSTQFTVGGATQVNLSGYTYVAYLFAHNAGGFGLTGTDNVISCGSYAGNGSGSGSNTINLGYEPQYLLVKRSSGIGGWWVIDNMRGATADGNDALLACNTSAAEVIDQKIAFTSTGFTLYDSSAEFNASGSTYIYIAIRRPNKPPTSGTQVFSPVTYTGDDTLSRLITTGFASDASIIRDRINGTAAYRENYIQDRLRGGGISLETDTTYAEGGDTGMTNPDMTNQYQSNSGILISVYTSRYNKNAASYITYNFKRAPGFFDVVCYTGTGSATTQAHNLGVAPELMIVKQRSASAFNWPVYSAATGASAFLELNTTAALYSPFSGMWNNTTPTASVFSLGTSGGVNGSGVTYVAYLFATLAGISKVGSYTGNGTSQTINCGFAAGARFILIKRTDSTGDWYVWDSARGIVSGNDPHLSLNTTAAEVTTDDSIDPDSTGFIVNQLAATNINVNAATYIYLAIA